MSEARDEIALVVQQWVLEAENDLTTAAHTLRLGEACPTDTICFHAQQCVEFGNSSAPGVCARKADPRRVRLAWRVGGEQVPVEVYA